MTPPPKDASVGTAEAISGLLRIGVSASLILVSLGSVLSFVQGSGYGRNASEVRRLVGPEGAFPRTADWLARGLVHHYGQAYIVAGLMLLIATPILRVAVSIAAFAKERDRAYVVITATVLILLLVSIGIGRGF